MRKISLIIVINLLVIYLLAELVCRGFWAVNYKVPYFRTDKIIYALYPNLGKVMDSYRDDESYKVLLIGGSVLHQEWGAVEEHIKSDLGKFSNPRFTVYNVSFPANTTMDSRIKMDILGSRHFDYVILYHGINDIRTNNCPDSVFKEDYSHYSWYKTLYALLDHKETGITVLPFSMIYIYNRFMEKSGRVTILDTHTPRDDWMGYGRFVKNKKVIKNNIEYIASKVQEDGGTVILPSFAWYIPDDYSETMFESRVLDYNEHFCKIEIWGRPDIVKQALNLNNSVIKDICSSNNKIISLDLNEHLPHNKEYFNDICRLTDKGSGLFAALITEKILENLLSDDCEDR